MSWNITVYSNTGLTTANTIDKPARLASAQQTVLPPVEIISPQHLSAIRVAATFEQLENVDYLAAQNGQYTYFYAVTGPAAPLAGDTWEIPLAMDAVMTASYRTNGVENFEVLDGIVERHHVNKADDVYGAFTEEDPLLVPSKELEYNMTMLFDDTADEQHVIVETTLDLGTMAQANDAVTYLDGTSGESVTVPQVASTPNNTSVRLGDLSGYSYKTPGTIYYDYDNQETQKGVQRARALGVEGGILNSYVLPDSDAVFTPGTDGAITAIDGTMQEDNHTPLYESPVAVHNMRVKYGSLHTYELVSPANGMRMSFKPEDLKLGDSGSSPTVVKVTDPRPNGRPYYRFKYFKGLDADHDGFFMNAVAGMEWANAPLVYSKASGSTLNQINYDTTMHAANRRLSDAEFQAQQMRNLGIASAVTGGLMNFQPADVYSAGGMNPVEMLGGQSIRGGDFAAAQTAMGKNMAIGAAGMALDVAGGMVRAQAGYQVAKQNLDREYELTAKKELQSLAIANNVVAPQLNFPRSESIRDFRGNGIYVIKYSPQQSDYAKLDKILEMYGYKDTKVLEATDFVGRRKFNYVKAAGVQIGGNLPKWLREAVAAQLSAGVRIWHQLPDTNAYTDGTNV